MSEALNPAPTETMGQADPIAALPEAFRDPATGPKWGEIVARLSGADELEAAATERAAGVPADPTAYTFAPSGDPIKLPDGSEAAIDPSDPFAQAIAAAAHKHGVPQTALSDLARAFIQANVEGEAQMDAVIASERASLGNKADDRVAATEAFLKANGATDEQLSVLRDFPALVPVFEAVQAKVGVAAVVAPAGQAGARSIAEVWYPTMRRR